MKDILLDCLHQNAERFPAGRLRDLDEQQWSDLVELAINHRVVPLLYDRLSNSFESTGHADKALENLALYSRHVAMNNLRYFAELRQYLEKLNHQDVSAILLKGIYLAYKVYPSEGLREMNDIDVLFHKYDLPVAVQALQSMGYSAGKTTEIEEETSKSHHLTPLIKEGVSVFELHWNITRPGRHYYIGPDELWERSGEITFHGQPARVLCPEDLLLHLCLHTSYQHMFSFGLRPLCDIAQTVKHFNAEINWEQLTQRSREYGWQKGVYLSLSMAHQLLGAKIPETILEKIKPDDLPPNVVDAGKDQVLTEKNVAESVSNKMISITTSRGYTERIQAAFQTMFFRRDLKLMLAPWRFDTTKHYFQYLGRMSKIIMNYILKLFRLARGDKKLRGIAGRKQTLQK